MYEEDQERVQRIISGDREAFDSFYNEYFRKVYNYTYMKVQDHGMAEDLTQEAFIAFIESLENYQGRASLLCWLFSISKNTIHNWFRRQKRDICCLERTEESLLENHDGGASTPLSDLEYQEFLTLYNSRFEKLAPESRSIFLKKHFEGKSIKEISKETRKTPGAIKTNLYRSKQFLLKEEHSCV